jgi:hypothetical protein
VGLALSRSVRALVALAALGGAAPGVVTTCAKAGGGHLIDGGTDLDCRGADGPRGPAEALLAALGARPRSRWRLPGRRTRCSTTLSHPSSPLSPHSLTPPPPLTQPRGVGARGVAGRGRKR